MYTVYPKLCKPTLKYSKMKCYHTLSR